MPRLSHALFTGTGLVIQLTLTAGMLLGLARLAHSQETPCAAVRALKPGTCITYNYGLPSVSYVLCNGPFSLCTTANCQCTTGNCTQLQKDQSAQAQCGPCDVVQTGLSIRIGLADKGAVSTISNFASAAGLGMKPCPQGPVVNCLGATCSTTDNTTSSCTCSVTPGAQYIMEPVGTDVSCSVLRSGAPENQGTQLLDQALQAAQSCIKS